MRTWYDVEPNTCSLLGVGIQWISAIHHLSLRVRRA